MKLGLFVAPNSSVQKSTSQILGLDSTPVDLTEENRIFLKSPPSSKVYLFIPNDDAQVIDHVTEQGQLIKDDLIAAYPLAFTEKNCDEVS